MKYDKQQSTPADVSDLERQVETLQRDIRNLQLEHDLLKKASALIKKDLGVNLQLLSNQEVVDALRNDYRVQELLGRLDLARSSYFYYRSSMRIADKYAQVRRIITDMCAAKLRDALLSALPDRLDLTLG